MGKVNEIRFFIRTDTVLVETATSLQAVNNGEEER